MKIINNRAFAILEFALMFIIVIGAFIIMRNYIQRGAYGNWHKAGQAFAFGRQYDSQKTIECDFDQTYNQWYDHNCFMYLSAQNCSNKDVTCTEGIISQGLCQQSSCSQASN